MKVNLTEAEVRKIARKVILRNELIFEETEPKGTPGVTIDEPQAAVKKEEEPKKPVKKIEEPVKKKTEYSDLVQVGSTDNLAVAAGGTLGRVGARTQDIVGSAATAAGVTYGSTALYLAAAGGGLTAAGTATGTLGTAGAFISGTAGAIGSGAALGTGSGAAGVLAGIASGPVGWGILGVTLAAGLIYLITPETIASDSLKEALDTTLYKRISAGFTKIYDELRKSDVPAMREMADKMNPKKCIDVPSSNEAAKIAQDIYTATQGGSLTGAFTGGSGLFGLGTDEAAIEKALKACKSYVGVSRVSHKHMKMHEGIIDDGNLLKVFTSELDNADMERYVNSVIDSLPYIIINEKQYSKEEFQQWLVESKDLVDELLADLKKAAEEEPEPELGVTSDTEDLNPPYVQQIQRLINEYCSQAGIDHVPLVEDNKWGPKTTALWKNKYLPHVFANHPIFKTMNLKIGNGKWAGISAQLSEKYPGYTSGQKGCVRFCIDALYGNDIKGKETDKSDTNISYFGGVSKKSTSRGSRKSQTDRRDEPEAAEKIVRRDTEEKFVPSDGRLTYKNIKIDVDIVGDRSIRKLSQLRGAAADSDDELKYDFLTNFGTGRLDLPVGETFQLHIVPKKDGKIKLQHKSTKLFKEMGIRTFAAPFHRFFKGLNMSDAEIKRLKIDGSSPIIIKVIMPPGLYNPAVER